MFLTVKDQILGDLSASAVMQLCDTTHVHAHTYRELVHSTKLGITIRDQLLQHFWYLILYEMIFLKRETKEPPIPQQGRELKCSWDFADDWHFRAAHVKF